MIIKSCETRNTMFCPLVVENLQLYRIPVNVECSFVLTICVNARENIVTVISARQTYYIYELAHCRPDKVQHMVCPLRDSGLEVN